MIGSVADTHAIIWYIFGDSRLSAPAKLHIETILQGGAKIAVSAISLVEITYLIERARIPAETFSRLARSLDDPDSGLVEAPITLSIVRTLSRVDASRIPDMPDRIIAATALHYNVPLVSRDSRIVLSSINTVW